MDRVDNKIDFVRMTTAKILEILTMIDLWDTWTLRSQQSSNKIDWRHLCGCTLIIIFIIIVFIIFIIIIMSLEKGNSECKPECAGVTNCIPTRQTKGCTLNSIRFSTNPR